MPTLDEIMSSRAEYLPNHNPNSWHVSGRRGLLDLQFRLLREDTVGQLRDAAREEIKTLQNPRDYNTGRIGVDQGARRYVYRNLEFAGFDFDSYHGLTLALSFDQPTDVRRRKTEHRKEWWFVSKRMRKDALICLVTADSVLFCVVTDKPVREVSGSQQGPRDPSDPDDGQMNLHASPTKAYIAARLIDVQTESVNQVMAYVSGNLRDASKSLCEFPGVILPSFQPTLKALQDLSDVQKVTMPFTGIVVPSGNAGPVSVPPPAYATDPEFKYDLQAVTSDESTELDIDADGFRGEFDVEAFRASTPLDHGQADALLAALTQSFALIQGPPGTGKSFVGTNLIKVLVDNAEAGQLGPIVCICWSNHALDAVILGLRRAGLEEGIVRMGGGSKSGELDDINLWKRARGTKQTAMERKEFAVVMQTMDDEAGAINKTLRKTSLVETFSAFEEYLKACYPRQHKEIFGAEDEDGFEDVRDGRPHEVLRAWLHQGEAGGSEPQMLDEEELLAQDMLDLSLLQRNFVCNFWLEEMKNALNRELGAALQRYRGLQAQLKTVRYDLWLRVLGEAKVIGITVSGLAKELEVFRKLKAKVLVCEEAGECLEAHLLGSLLPDLEHIILIGDHKQLRPRISNHSLSVENPRSTHRFNVSLFERLVEEGSAADGYGFPLSTLDVQRRMHPRISQLIRSTYPDLQDHQRVFAYPRVKGMSRRLQWFHHEEPEDEPEISSSTSYSNDFEVTMTVALVAHLVQQDEYEPHDIAVLTPYLGQLRKLRASLRKSFALMMNQNEEDELNQDDPELADEVPSRAKYLQLSRAVRLGTVDNFQGEEAKIVIISLVRSNADNRCGFLGTPNRITVALSRAKHGMYIIGNAETQCGRVEAWRDVFNIFVAEKAMGSSFSVPCPVHPRMTIEVCSAEDFARCMPGYEGQSSEDMADGCCPHCGCEGDLDDDEGDAVDAGSEISEGADEAVFA